MNLSTIVIVGTSSFVGLYLLWSYLAAMKFPVPHMSDEWYWEEEVED